MGPYCMISPSFFHQSPYQYSPLSDSTNVPPQSHLLSSFLPYTTLNPPTVSPQSLVNLSINHQSLNFSRTSRTISSVPYPLLTDSVRVQWFRHVTPLPTSVSISLQNIFPSLRISSFPLSVVVVPDITRHVSRTHKVPIQTPGDLNEVFLSLCPLQVNSLGLSSWYNPTTYEGISLSVFHGDRGLVFILTSHRIKSMTHTSFLCS